MKTIKIIVDRLKEMIDQSGIQYLEDHAYEIYQLFLNEKLVDDTDARILLICLLVRTIRCFAKAVTIKLLYLIGYSKAVA